MKKKIILTLFLCLISLTSCRSLPHYDIDESIDYSTFDEYKLDNINNLYSQKEDVYAVYFYQDNCSGCEKIKNSILGYLNEFKKDEKGLKVYLYNSSRLNEEYPSFKKGSGNLEEDKEEMINAKVSDVTKTYFIATPSLYVVTSSFLVDFYYGTDVAYYLVYDSVYDSRNYDEYQNSYLEIEDFYEVKKSKYYVYLYYETCPHCLRTRKAVLNYLENHDDLYLINMYPSSSEEGIINRGKFKKADVGSTDEFKNYIEKMKKEGTNEVSSTYYAYVPSLYIIDNNKFSDAMVGEEEVRNFLNSF